MLNSIKSELVLSKKGYMWLAITIGSVWLFGECLGAGIMTMAGDVDTYFSVGSILALVGAAILIWFNGFWNATGRYSMAVSMGCTRRNFVVASFVSTLLQALLALVLTIITSQISELIYRISFSQLPPDGEFYGVLTASFLLEHGWKFILGAIAVVLVGYCSGALFQRFGKIFLIIFWVLYMFSALSANSISHVLETRDTTTLLGKIFVPASDALSSLPIGFLPILGIIIAVVIVVYSARILLRGSVKF